MVIITPLEILTHYLQSRGQSGQGQNGHFRFRERGHCSLYINKIFIL